MQATQNTTHTDDDLIESLIRFYRTYYREELGTLAQHYPSEQVAVEIEYGDLYQHDDTFAEDWLKNPETAQEYANQALYETDLPADLSLNQDGEQPAEVRLVDLPEDRVYYPGGYSPSDIPGEYAAIRGEVAMATDVYSRITEAAFECQRCGTMTHIPQTGEGFQEPHECRGCERQGPFRVNHDKSEFVDFQAVRLQEPPSVAGGEGATVGVQMEADLTDSVDTGDEVVIYGTLHLRQKTKGRQKTAKFETYVDANHIEFEESSAKDLDITNDERERIHALADGADGPPLEVGADSFATGIYGLTHVKKAAILQLVGGELVEYQDGSTDRGDFHILLIGDPSAGKSEIVDAVEQIAPRAAAVSAANTGKAGMTASAVRDDFGDGEWTLKPGAFAKANGGMVCVEELDDLDAEKRAAMLEPMSKQQIAVSKAGINTKLQTRVGVIAAANPKHGRFDPYEPVTEQFVFGSAMLSRFDLIFTFRDKPDHDRDTQIAGHIADHRRAGKLQKRDELTEDESAAAAVEAPVDGDLLRKWVALAKRSPPPIADKDARENAKETFVSLRGSNGYEPDDPVPVTWRSWEAVYRIAEAAAKFEFSDTIEKRHFETATELIGKSMQDIGKNEDDELDADVVETGVSKPQADRKKSVEELLKEFASAGPIPYDELAAEAQTNDYGLDEETIRAEVESFKDRGWAYEPKTGKTVKWLGRA